MQRLDLAIAGGAGGFTPPSVASCPPPSVAPAPAFWPKPGQNGENSHTLVIQMSYACHTLCDRQKPRQINAMTRAAPVCANLPRAPRQAFVNRRAAA
jgi:hypothetical protein